MPALLSNRSVYLCRKLDCLSSLCCFIVGRRIRNSLQALWLFIVRYMVIYFVQLVLCLFVMMLLFLFKLSGVLVRAVVDKVRHLVGVPPPDGRLREVEHLSTAKETQTQRPFLSENKQKKKTT